MILTEVAVLHNNSTYSTIALWDTGASQTHISEDILNALDIKFYGEANTISHTGSSKVKKYFASIKLPTGHILENITVLSGRSFKINGNEVDVLIGMDIISCGNFQIENVGEETVFTFSLPSDEEKIIETNLF